MAKAALSGFRNEDWVVSEFNNWKTSYWARQWLESMSYNPNKIEHLCAQTTRNMGFFNKADVLVLVESNVEWISVKKFTASFNQIDKRWTDTYARLWNIPNDVAEIIKRYCGEQGYRPRDLLADEQLKSITDVRRFNMNELSQVQREQVLDFFNENQQKIVKDVVSGRGKAAAKWMLVVEEEKDSPKRSVIIPISLAIEYCVGGAAITAKGNIKLGNLTVQRKGGDKGARTAQQLQFKFSPKGIFDLQGVKIINKS